MACRLPADGVPAGRVKARPRRSQHRQTRVANALAATCKASHRLLGIVHANDGMHGWQGLIEVAYAG